MYSIVKIYSTNFDEITGFLEHFFSNKISISYNRPYWQKIYTNPVEIADIVAAFIDNKEKYPSSNMWVSLDKSTYINISSHNYNGFIKYLFERYPY